MALLFLWEQGAGIALGSNSGVPIPLFSGTECCGQCVCSLKTQKLVDRQGPTNPRTSSNTQPPPNPPFIFLKTQKLTKTSEVLLALGAPGLLGCLRPLRGTISK